jgi:hypothetical protein
MPKIKIIFKYISLCPEYHRAIRKISLKRLKCKFVSKFSRPIPLPSFRKTLAASMDTNCAD